MLSSAAERRRLISTLLPGLASEGLLDAVLEVEALLVAMAPGGLQRWRRLSWLALLRHLRDHVHEVAEEPMRVDGDSRHLTAAHVAARAMMILQRVLDRD